MAFQGGHVEGSVEIAAANKCSNKHEHGMKGKDSSHCSFQMRRTRLSLSPASS
jgi:hypothetical protein